ncbi:MAG TPA: tRNA pseudouridine(38-40) synthase TruA [Sporolactobacillaceae bacterium]|nr:tRNA pseudouridine(38-40) synthase TruA [Sporolactobacillaceae bacterium]
MQRLKCTISYDGTEFSGYQIQPNGRTVQGEIEHVLMRMHKGRQVRISASGRTDAGVHAVGQVIHFDTELDIPESGWIRALNTQLPHDIQVFKVEKSGQEFHSRFATKKKEYRYRILNCLERDLFRRNYVYHVPELLNIDAMKDAAQYILGEHDFTSFCAAGSSVKDKVRTVYELELIPKEDELIIRIVGNGFLYQMVRIIVGNLLEVGRGKIEPGQIKEILDARDRRKALYTAPPQGLYLWHVDYANS